MKWNERSRQIFFHLFVKRSDTKTSTLIIDGLSRSPPSSNDLFHSEQLITRMNKLRKAEYLCDVTLKVDQTLFPAHRLVLAAASDYFAAMFTGEVSRSIALCPRGTIAFRWPNDIWTWSNWKASVRRWWKSCSIRSTAKQWQWTVTTFKTFFQLLRYFSWMPQVREELLLGLHRSVLFRW